MVEPTASQEEIRKNYLRLVRAYHPDKHGNKKEYSDRFHEINEAYKILGDLDNRLKYTMMLNREDRLMKELDDHEARLDGEIED